MHGIVKLFILGTIFNSCNCDLTFNGKNVKNLSFNDYLETIMRDSLAFELKGYSYMNLRDNNSYMLLFPDKTIVYLKHNYCNLEITKITQNTSTKYITEENAKENTTKVLNKLLKYYIGLLDSNENTIKIYLNKTRFNQKSLPPYKNKAEEKDIEWVVLVYLYKELQAESRKKIWDYYHSVYLGGNWYYYTE